MVKSPNELNRRFCHGSIQRIRLVNFMTYESFEWFPEPGLNIILGGNGTGKSTITCAICLAFGGSTSIIGRASRMVDFVKRGKTKAEILLELYNQDGDNWIIQREINVSNQSQFLLNGTKVAMKEVLGLGWKLNVHVENMCQFLPQDKVSDFVRLSPCDLLKNTERCVNDEEIFVMHERLISRSFDRAVCERSHSKLLTDMDTCKKMNELIKPEVDRIRYHQNLLARISWMTTLEKILEYREAYGDFEAFTKIYENGMKMIAGFDRRLQDAQASARHALTTVDNQKNRMNDLESQYNQWCGEKLSEHFEKIDSLTKKLKSEDAQFKLKVDMQKQYQTDAENLKQEIKTIFGSIDSTAVENHEENVRNFEEQINQRQSELSTLKGKIQKIDENISGLTFAKLATQRQLRSMDDRSEKQLMKLQSRNPSAYGACMWLRQHGSSKLSHKWYDPICMCIEIPDLDLARYCEYAIPSRDMYAMFLFEDVNDLKLFHEEVNKRRGLSVNAAVISKNHSRDSFKNDESKQYRKFGFRSSVLEAIEGPDDVLNYLCQYYKIHKILIGDQSTNSHIKTIVDSHPEISTFFTDTWLYRVIKSRHSPQNCSVVSRPIPKRAVYFMDYADCKTVDKLRQQVKDIDVQIGAQERSKQKQNELCDPSREKYELLMEKLILEKNLLSSYQVRQDSIKRLKQRVKFIESNMMNVQEEEMALRRNFEAAFIELIANEISSMYSTMKEIKVIHDSMLDARAELKMYCQELNVKNNEQRSALEELECRKRELAGNRTKLQQLFEVATSSSSLVKQTLVKLDGCKQIANRLFRAEPNILTFLKSSANPRNVLKQFKEACTNSDCPIEIDNSDVKMVKEDVLKLQAQSEMMSSGDKQLLKQYADREAEIAELEQSLLCVVEKLKTDKDEIDNLRSNWLSIVNAMIEKINSKFSQLFTELHCCGRVSLNVPDDVLDFNNYGIDIEVSFRSEIALKSLSVGFQSGGERSVATMLYLLALQTITDCPFRCVDEINQGMDEKNERKVLELVIKQVSKYSQQYFLISPKLLKNIDYGEQPVNIAVICKQVTGSQSLSFGKSFDRSQ